MCFVRVESFRCKLFFDPTLSGQSDPAIVVVDLLDDDADAAAARDP